MKKIVAFLALIGIVVFSSCTGPEGPSGQNGQDGLLSEVFELKNINFSNTASGYNIYQKLTPKIYASDVILIYRLSGAIDSNTPVWQSIPRTIFFSGSPDELDYDFDFSKEDFTIYARGNYNLSTRPQYLNNQTFRIVIVPGSFSKTLNTNNYADVIKALNINESQVQNINF